MNLDNPWLRMPRPRASYRHYKGGVYSVITVGRLSEQRDQLCVVYRSQERDTVWIRPLGMWFELVEWQDGVFRPRFVPAHKAPIETFVELDPKPKEFFSRSTRLPGTNAAIVEAIRLTTGMVPELCRVGGGIRATVGELYAGQGNTEKEALCALLQFVAGKVDAP